MCPPSGIGGSEVRSVEIGGTVQRMEIGFEMWIKDYESKLVTAAKGVEIVKSGMRVGIGIGDQPESLIQALADRKDELSNVEIFSMAPTKDIIGIANSQGAFKLNVDMVTGLARDMVNRGAADYTPNLISLAFKGIDERSDSEKSFDIVFVRVSPPNAHGFCSFGLSLFNNRSYAKRARIVVAEVDKDKDAVRTYGTNYIHVSEIQLFAEAAKSKDPISGTKLTLQDIDNKSRAIAQNTKHLIRHGDTIQLGPSQICRALPLLDVFENVEILNVYAPIVYQELLDWVIKRNSSQRKREKRIKIITSGFPDLSDEQEDYITFNPDVVLYDMEDINSIPTIASNKCMVAINTPIEIDLTGQISADSVGTEIWSGAAGQIEFGIGAMLSPGGRSIALLPSTNKRGDISRITATLPLGTAVSIQRSFADYVVTENGSAELLGLCLRERIERLMLLADPRFREKLKLEGKEIWNYEIM